ncbi:hypothetical protein IKQ19_08560 [Candidatus Saccharibacteria bacterium]|nr:hypothetical protein [Candidatus Saccharibacteria bacterium]
MRIAFLIILLILLYGCSVHEANVSKGRFDVDLPKPFWGQGVWVMPNTVYFKGNVAYSIGDKETIPLDGLENEGYDRRFGKSLPKERAEFEYRLKENPFSGSLDVFVKRWVFLGGGRVEVDPYPSVTLFAGLNSLVGEFGVGTRLGYSKDKAAYSGKYLSVEYELHSNTAYSGEIENTVFKGEFEETHSYNNANFGLYAYSSLFVTEHFSLNFSTGYYQPWLFRSSLQLDNIEVPGDYDITIDFPYFLSQYAGATISLFDHVLLSVGETYYYTRSPASANNIWQTHFSLSYMY